MAIHSRLSLPVFSLVVFLSLFTSPDLFAVEERWLVFGRVQEDPVKAIQDRQGFVDYIAKKLAPLGIVGGKILVVDKISMLAQALKEGKVDLFHDSLVPTLVLSKRTGSVPILNQWKYGEEEYYSVIVVKKESGINNLTDLKGKVMAFDEPHSTSAHILPRMLLVEKKLKLVQVISPGGTRPDAVGYTHVHDGDSAHLLVTGRVDAAATSLRELKELRPEIQDRLKIIAQTRSVPRLLISVRKDLNAKITSALKETLLAMDKDPEGQGVLKTQQRTTKITEILPGSLEQLRDVERFVFLTLGPQVNSW